MVELDKSIRTKIINFSYSEDKRSVLCELLGEKQYITQLHWKCIIYETEEVPDVPPNASEMIPQLEKCAILAFFGALAPGSPIEREQEHLSQLFKSAGPLLEALNGHDRRRVPIGKALDDYQITPLGLSHVSVKSYLEWLVESEDEIKQQFQEHHSHSFAETRNPPYFDFVRRALYLWKRWREEEPGGSKEGGPAARFLVAAANPMLRYAKKELGLHMRRKGSVELSEESAGSLIAYLKKNYPKQFEPLLDIPFPIIAPFFKEVRRKKGKNRPKNSP